MKPLTNPFEFEFITINEQGAVQARQRSHAQQFVEDLENGTWLEMVMISEGSFRMGSPGWEGFEDERPQHLVSVPSFLIGKYPITQEQWRAVMGKMPPCRFKGGKRPVENISWSEAQTFCQRLSAQTGHDYHLPGEAQWEYACRAQTTTAFHTGPTLTADFANYKGQFTYRSEPATHERHETTEVGRFPPNAFGLYDMHGNVWEWCMDVWHEDYTGAPTNGKAWLSSKEVSFRVGRGGSWHDTPDVCRSAARLKIRAAEGDEFTGFRVATNFFVG